MKDKAIAKAVKLAGTLIAMPILMVLELGTAAIELCDDIVKGITYVVSSEDDEKYANEIKEIFKKEEKEE